MDIDIEVVLLILIGFVFIVYSSIGLLKGEKKHKKDFDTILKYKEENSKDWQVEIGRIRSEFAITLSEMQSEILDLRNEVSLLINPSKKEMEEEQILEEEIITGKEIMDQEIIDVSYQLEEESFDSIEEVMTIKKEKENIIEGIKEKEKSTISEEKIKNNYKPVEEIQILINQGLSIEEISEKLGIGKGEVLLIKQLYVD